MIITKRIIQLSSLKNNRNCKECKMPIFVTRNGNAEMVIMDADFFDNYLSPYIIDDEIDVAKALEYMPLFIKNRFVIDVL